MILLVVFAKMVLLNISRVQLLVYLGSSYFSSSRICHIVWTQICTRTHNLNSPVCSSATVEVRHRTVANVVIV